MTDKESLLKKLELINDEIESEKDDLIFLLEHTRIETINLKQFHFNIFELLLKRDNIQTELFNNYTIIISNDS